VVEEIAYDEPNKHSQQPQLKRLSGGQRRGLSAPNRNTNGFTMVMQQES